MARRALYRWVKGPDGVGHFVELAARDYENPAPFVHQDSMPALKHPVTGEMVESRTRWAAINKEHKLDVVGNDLLSNRKGPSPDRISDEAFKKAHDKAQAILNDPARRNEWRNQRLAIMEKNARMIGGQQGR